MVGYIVVEPELRVEQVPQRLLGWPSLLWPAERNIVPEKSPGEPASMFNASDLYSRTKLSGTEISLYVWSRRDANALPESVLNAILELAKRDEAIE